MSDVTWYWSEKSGILKDYQDGDTDEEVFELKDGTEVELDNGDIGVLRDINPNEDFVEDDEYWAELETNSWAAFREVFPHQIKRVTRTAEAMAGREMLSRDTLAQEIQSRIMSGFNDIDIDETFYEGNGVITAGGYHDGRYLAFTVTVAEPEVQ